MKNYLYAGILNISNFDTSDIYKTGYKNMFIANTAFANCSRTKLIYDIELELELNWWSEPIFDPFISLLVHSGPPMVTNANTQDLLSETSFIDLATENSLLYRKYDYNLQKRNDIRGELGISYSSFYSYRKQGYGKFFGTLQPYEPISLALTVARSVLGIAATHVTFQIACTITWEEWS
jgi:hypothetical protein